MLLPMLHPTGLRNDADALLVPSPDDRALSRCHLLDREDAIMDMLCCRHQDNKCHLISRRVRL
jgi:hypothetical protein